LELGLFGGSFNPPHVGHVLAAVYTLSVAAVDKVLVVPVYRHAFGKELAAFEERVALCKLAFQCIDGAVISEIERDLPVPSRTLRTLEALERVYPGDGFRLIVGSDIVGEIDQWQAVDQIKRKAPLLVLPRTGEGAGTPLLPHVSSTEVRRLLTEWRTAEEVTVRESAWSKLQERIPRLVLERIAQRDLYAEA
jgi:nicotinate-nucleotide adenylyltransferase